MTGIPPVKKLLSGKLGLGILFAVGIALVAVPTYAHYARRRAHV